MKSPIRHSCYRRYVRPAALRPIGITRCRPVTHESQGAQYPGTAPLILRHPVVHPIGIAHRPYEITPQFVRHVLMSAPSPKCRSMAGTYREVRHEVARYEWTRGKEGRPMTST